MGDDNPFSAWYTVRSAAGIPLRAQIGVVRPGKGWKIAGLSEKRRLNR